MRTIRCLVLASCAALGAWGMFRMPSNAPVERLVSNMGDYVKAHPQDANGYYTLGRIHYLAFALNAKEIPSTQDGQNMFSPGRPIEQPHDRNAISETQRATHLKEALRLLRKAGSAQESDRQPVGASFLRAVVSLDWPVETQRLEQDSRLAGLCRVPVRDR